MLVTDAPIGFALDRPFDVRPDGEPYDVVLLFCPHVADLDRAWSSASARIVVNGALWVAWPKRSSGVASDLTDNIVRTYALDHGLVDTKVCAIDTTWSGLKLVRRLADR